MDAAAATVLARAAIEKIELRISAVNGPAAAGADDQKAAADDRKGKSADDRKAATADDRTAAATDDDRSTIDKSRIEEAPATLAALASALEGAFVRCAY